MVPVQGAKTEKYHVYNSLVVINFQNTQEIKISQSGAKDANIFGKNYTVG